MEVCCDCVFINTNFISCIKFLYTNCMVCVNESITGNGFIIGSWFTMDKKIEDSELLEFIGDKTVTINQVFNNFPMSRDNIAVRLRKLAKEGKLIKCTTYGRKTTFKMNNEKTNQAT